MPARRVTRAGLGALVLAATCAAPAASSAATEPLSAPRIVAHFKQSAKQTPENFALLPNGDFDVAFSSAHQIARVTPRGATKVLATLPVPANGGTKTPELGAAATAGIERAPNGTVYFTYSTGTAGLTGIWRLNGHRQPTRIAKLPGAKGAHAFLNGLALDPRTNMLYTTDTAAGVVWRVPAHGGTATKWATGKQLKQVDGLKIHHGAVWVGSASTDKLMRIPIRADGKAGAVATRATFPKGELLDDFAFTGRGDTTLVALNRASKVALVRPNGSYKIVLTKADGLDNPSSIRIRGNTAYVASAAYFTGHDPNLLKSRIRR